MARAVERLLLILAGFLAAALAASAFLHLALFAAAGFDAGQMAWAAAGSLLVSIPFTALFVGYFAFVPSVAAVAVLELWSVRGAFGNVAAGAAVGGALAVWLRQAGQGAAAVADALDPAGVNAAARPVEWGLLGTIVAGGAAAGLAYWLVAGRSAGRWREPPLTAPGPTGS